MRHIFVITSICFLASCWFGFAHETANMLFQQGLYAEEVQGDLNRALNFYTKLIESFPSDRLWVARALLQSGFCFEKLGHKQAHQVYQRILDDYPDQWEIARAARENLARLEKSTMRNPNSEIVRYYFERLGIDILTATSPDGKYLAFTDWTTGNLVIKELETGQRKILTAANWPHSIEFAMRPLWSYDGKSIAYSWYRQAHLTELRIVDLTTGVCRAVYSQPGISIAAQDWQPNGKAILCNMTYFNKDISFCLGLLSLDTGQVQDFLLLDINSRCIKFSPDGKYIAYDTQQPDNRHIYILDLETLQTRQISSGLFGGKGYDAPIWSPDGKILFFRSYRLGQYDLWASPIHRGKPAEESYLVQSDLTNALLAMKGIQHSNPSKTDFTQNGDFRRLTNNRRSQSFFEDFSTSALDSAWFVYEWNKPNVYDYDTFGRFSLSAHPGHLRYFLDPIMAEVYVHNSLPTFSGWYWLYPGLQINRVLKGDNWELEARITYAMVDGVGGRAFDLMICFEPEQDRSSALLISRTKDFNNSNLKIQLLDRGIVTAANDSCLAAGDSLGVTHFTYVYRITRADTLFLVDLSSDNRKSFHPALVGSLRSDFRGLPQLLVLTGNSWFAPAGAYADWDYVRFTILD